MMMGRIYISLLLLMTLLIHHAIDGSTSGGSIAYAPIVDHLRGSLGHEDLTTQNLRYFNCLYRGDTMVRSDVLISHDGTYAAKFYNNDFCVGSISYGYWYAGWCLQLNTADLGEVRIGDDGYMKIYTTSGVLVWRSDRRIEASSSGGFLTMENRGNTVLWNNYPYQFVWDCSNGGYGYIYANGQPVYHSIGYCYVQTYKQPAVDDTCTALPVVPTQPPTQQPTQPTFPPTQSPTEQPTVELTDEPSPFPTLKPTQPTAQPTINPTMSPTKQPSKRPSFQPTPLPTPSPTLSPTPQPTQPTPQPTPRPTPQPTTKSPTNKPKPSLQPVFRAPTLSPTTAQPQIDTTGSKDSTSSSANNQQSEILFYIYYVVIPIVGSTLLWCISFRLYRSFRVRQKVGRGGNDDPFGQPNQQQNFQERPYLANATIPTRAQPQDYAYATIISSELPPTSGGGGGEYELVPSAPPYYPSPFDEYGAKKDQKRVTEAYPTYIQALYVEPVEDIVTLGTE
jgi:hypothetical protein